MLGQVSSQMNNVMLTDNCSSEKNIKKARKQDAISRVQNAFLEEIEKGESTQNAFLSSLQAINKKYNPKQDTYNGIAFDNQKECIVYSSSIRAVKIQPKTIKKVLKAFEMIVPVLIKIMDLFSNTEDI